MATKKRQPSLSNQKPSGESPKLIRFDFQPNATPEEIAKGINEMVKKYRKGQESENPAKEDSST